MKNLLSLKNLLIAFALALFLPTAVLPKAAENDDILELTKTYEKMKSLEADFTQTVRFADFDHQSVSKGKVFFHKGQDASPGKMRWDYFEPTKQQIFVNGDQILHYTPEHQQVLKGKMSKQSGLPLDLFMSMEKIRELFDISPTGKHELLLIPKEPESPTTKIGITVVPSPTAKGLLIQKVVLYEKNGNQSTFLFGHLKMNGTLSEDLFLLKVPDGVEVIEAP